MLPPAIHSFSEHRCHDNPHVTGYKHTTSLQGFGLGKAQTGITHTFFFFFKPRFRDAFFLYKMHRSYQPVLPCGNKYLQLKWDKEKYEGHKKRVGMTV